MTYPIFDFINGLLPGLKKESILEDLRVSLDSYDKNLTPVLDKITALHKDKFKSQNARDLNDAFNRAYKGAIKGRPNMLLTLKEASSNIRVNADFVVKCLEEILESNVIPDGITSRKATMIRLAKQITFLVEYSLDLMNVILTNEAIHLNSELQESMEVSKGAMIRVEKNLIRFAYAVADFSKKPDDFVKLYKKMKDIYVGGSNSKNAAAAASEIEIDPYDSRLVHNVAYNPIYHVRMAIAGWQARRYQNAKEKKKLLELRVLQLKAEYDNKKDPKILNEINYTQNRVDKIDRELHEVDEDLGIA